MDSIGGTNGKESGHIPEATKINKETQFQNHEIEDLEKQTSKLRKKVFEILNSELILSEGSSKPLDDETKLIKSYLHKWSSDENFDFLWCRRQKERFINLEGFFIELFDKGLVQNIEDLNPNNEHSTSYRYFFNFDCLFSEKNIEILKSNFSFPITRTLAMFSLINSSSDHFEDEISATNFWVNNLDKIFSQTLNKISDSEDLNSILSSKLLEQFIKIEYANKTSNRPIEKLYVKFRDTEQLKKLDSKELEQLLIDAFVSIIVFENDNSDNFPLSKLKKSFVHEQINKLGPGFSDYASEEYRNKRIRFYNSQLAFLKLLAPNQVLDLAKDLISTVSQSYFCPVLGEKINFQELLKKEILTGNLEVFHWFYWLNDQGAITEKLGYILSAQDDNERFQSANKILDNLLLLESTGKSDIKLSRSAFDTFFWNNNERGFYALLDSLKPEHKAQIVNKTLDKFLDLDLRKYKLLDKASRHILLTGVNGLDPKDKSGLLNKITKGILQIDITKSSYSKKYFLLYNFSNFINNSGLEDTQRKSYLKKFMEKIFEKLKSNSASPNKKFFLKLFLLQNPELVKAGSSIEVSKEFFNNLSKSLWDDFANNIFVNNKDLTNFFISNFSQQSNIDKSGPFEQALSQEILEFANDEKFWEALTPLIKNRYLYLLKKGFDTLIAKSKQKVDVITNMQIIKELYEYQLKQDQQNLNSKIKSVGSSAKNKFDFLSRLEDIDLLGRSSFICSKAKDFFHYTPNQGSYKTALDCLFTSKQIVKDSLGIDLLKTEEVNKLKEISSKINNKYETPKEQFRNLHTLTTILMKERWNTEITKLSREIHQEENIEEEIDSNICRTSELISMLVKYLKINETEGYGKKACRSTIKEFLKFTLTIVQLSDTTFQTRKAIVNALFKKLKAIVDQKSQIVASDIKPLRQSIGAILIENLFDNLENNSLLLSKEDVNAIKDHIVTNKSTWNKRGFLETLAKYYTFQEEPGKKAVERYLYKLSKSETKNDSFINVPRLTEAEKEVRDFVGEKLNKIFNDGYEKNIVIQSQKNKIQDAYSNEWSNFLSHIGIENNSGQSLSSEDAFEDLKKDFFKSLATKLTGPELDKLWGLLCDIRKHLSNNLDFDFYKIKQWKDNLASMNLENKVPALDDAIRNLDNLLKIQKTAKEVVKEAKFLVTNDQHRLLESALSPQRTCQIIDNETRYNRTGMPLWRAQSGDIALAQMITENENNEQIRSRAILEVAKNKLDGKKVLLVEAIYSDGAIANDDFIEEIVKWAKSTKEFKYVLISNKNLTIEDNDKANIAKVDIEYLKKEGEIYRDTDWSKRQYAIDLYPKKLRVQKPSLRKVRSARYRTLSLSR